MSTFKYSRWVSKYATLAFAASLLSASFGCSPQVTTNEPVQHAVESAQPQAVVSGSPKLYTAIPATVSPKASSEPVAVTGKASGKTGPASTQAFGPSDKPVEIPTKIPAAKREFPCDPYEGMTVEEIAKIDPMHPRAQHGMHEKERPPVLKSSKPMPEQIRDFLAATAEMQDAKVSFTQKDVLELSASLDPGKIAKLAKTAAEDKERITELRDTLKLMPYPERATRYRNKLILGLSGVQETAEEAAKLTTYKDKSDLAAALNKLSDMMSRAKSDLDGAARSIRGDLATDYL